MEEATQAEVMQQAPQAEVMEEAPQAEVMQETQQAEVMQEPPWRFPVHIRFRALACTLHKLADPGSSGCQ